ncbi:MAG: N-acetyltransferase family protein [Pseudomonadota bacterium]
MLEFNDISYSEVSIIKELWEKNRKYHENISEFFSDSYKGIEFESRIKGFEAFDGDSMKITVARDDNRLIGYCISTALDGKGEVESIHVDENVRGGGVGRQLVERHLCWMRDKGCKIIGVTVSQENEPTIGFYRKLGFYPNTLYMQQK